MYIYNTTFGIDSAIEKEFIHWLRTIFIASAIGEESGEAYFSAPEILRVLGGEPGVMSLAVHMRANDKKDIDDWYADYGSRLFSDVMDRWQGQVVYFTTTLEVL